MNERTPAVIGIDPSYTGFATVLFEHTGDDANSYTPTLHDFSEGSGPVRLRRIYDTLRSAFYDATHRYDVRHVVIEGYAHGAKFGRELAGELGGVLRLALVHHFDPVCLHVVAPTSLKKFTTGSGVASKDVMLLTVFKRWGVSITDNNLADAYAAARLAGLLESGGTHKYEKEVIENLLTKDA